jgi:hypothetical protein
MAQSDWLRRARTPFTKETNRSRSAVDADREAKRSAGTRVQRPSHRRESAPVRTASLASGTTSRIWRSTSVVEAADPVDDVAGWWG